MHRYLVEADKLKQSVREIERQIQDIQQFSQFNLSDKEEYFQRICNDFLANIEVIFFSLLARCLEGSFLI